MCKAIEGIREDAREEGFEQGIGFGTEKTQKEVSMRMAAEGMAISLIARLVNTKEEVVEGWIAEAAIG